MQTIYLDISNKGVVPTIYAKQGDVGRKFSAVLTDAGVPYKIASGSRFSVWYNGDSGEGNYTDIGGHSAFNISANSVEVELIVQMLSVPGNGLICLMLSGNDGKQIGSWNIPYVCEEVPGLGSETATEYYTAFSKALDDLRDVSQKFTPESIGAAPAGFGLGKAEAFSIAEIDTIVRPGFYSSGDSATVGGYSNGRWWMLVKAYGDGTHFVTQELHSFKTTNGVKLVRHRLNSTWTEWEFEDPIMELATEYRTTERFSMTPIHKQTIYLGAMTGGGTKTVEHGIAITGYPIDCKLFDTTGAIFDLVSFTETDITVAAPATYKGYGVYAILSYVK